MTQRERYKARVRHRRREPLCFRGPLLVTLREGLNFTRGEVAEAVGRTTGNRKNTNATVRHWECDDRSPWGVSIAGLCHLFGVQPADFYHAEKTESHPNRLKLRMVRKLKFSGKALTRLMRAADVHVLSLANDVAEYTGIHTISRATIQNWERDGNDPRGVCVAALCHLLDCDVSDFYGVLKAPKL